MHFIASIVRISILLVFLACPWIVSSAQESKPNIVWLVTEDNSVHYLQLYREGGAPMPNIERLAEGGVVFNHAFSNAPVCSTARSTIISGCYGPRMFSQFHRRSVLVPLPEGQQMFPYYLRQVGYYTTNNSKEDYNYIKGEGVWDESSRRATYRNRKSGQPFFHVQNFGVTHEGQLHFTREEMESSPTQTNVDTVPVFPIHPDTELFRYTNAYYRDRHMLADEQMGAFLEQLEADGLMDDTIIFYYGDHGGVLPGSKGYLYETGLHVPLVVFVPEKWRQLLPMDLDAGEPIETGRRVDGFVQFVDLGPTVLNLAGVAVPKAMDGQPFLGKGVALHELNARDTAFSYADRFDEKWDLVRAMRKGRYKYMRNYQPFTVDALQNNYRYRMLAYKQWRDFFRAGLLNEAQSHFFTKRPAEALYDLEADPFETKNLAGHPDYDGVLWEMRGLLRRQVESMPDLSFIPEPMLVTYAAENPVRFGQKHQALIAELVGIADLSLLPWDEAKAGIKEALSSDTAMKRYWALIACSTFGMDAKGLAPQIQVMAEADPHNLVRMRAAEFLGLTRLGDPRPPLYACLKQAMSPEEAAFVLNTVVLLQDTVPGITFELDRAWVPAEWLENVQSNVRRRYDYLQGEL